MAGSGRDQSIEQAGASLRTALIRLRARARRILLIRAGAGVVACTLGALLLAGLIDYLLRLPSGVRFVLLGGGLAGLVWMLRFWMLRAMRFAPSLTSVALRIEGSGPGGPVNRLLASALELSGSTDPTSDPQLRAAAVREATEAMDRVEPQGLIRTEPARNGLALLGVVFVVAMLPTLLAPALSVTALARVLTPWSGVEWPKRTMIAEAGSPRVHPAGEPLMLRALLTRTNRGLGQTDVDVRYRVVRDDAAEPWRVVALAPQMREESFEGEIGELYERLIDTPALERDARLEYRFETRDDRGSTQRVLLTPRPRLTSARLSATPPDYAVDAGITGVLAGGAYELDVQSRVSAPQLPVLAGSRVSLELGFNKPIPVGEDREAFAQQQLGDASLGPMLTPSADGTSWDLTLQAEQSLLLEVSPVDEHGLSPNSARMVRIDVIRDEPPGVAITEPVRDEAVLATAEIRVAGEARDDVGLRSIELTRQLLRADGGSAGASPEPMGEEQILRRIDITGSLAGSVQALLRLEELDLIPGDELLLYAVALDVYEREGEIREPARSQPRRLRIIDATELEAQIRGELSAIRRSAMRLDEQQRSITQQMREQGADAMAQGRQEAMTQRLEAQGEALSRLRERLQRNAMEESALSGLLDDAQAIAQEAQQASEQASQELGAAEPDQAAANQAQDEVREALADLIATLDRGEDAWVARRSVEQLLEEQRRIEEATRDLGSRTAGRSVDQLSETELSELERILERQEQAARRARETLEELDRRADQLAARDPTQASALRDASSRGRSARLEDRLNEASEQISQNRTAEATGQQQRAIEALEEMLDQLLNAEQRRDEVLRRILASLIESIESLIAQQEEQLAALDRAAGGSLTGLDQGMIRLNSNTLAVIQSAAQAPGDIQTLIDLLSSAERSQAEAVDSLRVDDEPVARAQETASLDALRRARQEAERLDEEAAEREQDRRLQQLLTAYRELLEVQVVLTSETEPYIARELNRRDRAEVRTLGERQQTIGEQINALRTEHADLAQTQVFDFAHTRLEQSTAAAADTLRRGEADRGVQRSQATTIRLLQSFLEALAQTPPRDDPFGQGAGGGGGGGGGQGQQPLVPPLAELKLLRAMQIEAAEWTRSIDEFGADGAELDRLSTLQSELAERGQRLIEQMQQNAPAPQGQTPPGETPPGEGGEAGPAPSPAPLRAGSPQRVLQERGR